MPTYYRVRDPAWARKSSRPAGRPGMMMNGVVVMAPSRLDTTGVFGAVWQGWMSQVRVYLDGLWVTHPLGYDEDLGELLIEARGRPQLVRGRVTACPKAKRF